MHFLRRAAQTVAAAVCLALMACAGTPQSTGAPAMPDHKQQVVDLLKSFETGDSTRLDVISPDKYIQHNLGVPDGLAGLKSMLQGRPAGSTKVNTVRVYQDGAFVFAQTEYDFSGNARIGFDIFRFENDRIVEHWDNLQARAAAPSPGAHTMTDGPTVATDLDKTAANKALIQRYMDDLLAGRKETFTSSFDGDSYIQHSPLVADKLAGLFAGLQALARQGLSVKYTQVHRILGEGSVVLVVAEGSFGDKPSAYYDLYRIENGKIAEHWDTIAPIPPHAEWKNANGKF
jgi:predicted SnoaL-like aldol condensation-catalyzing enzyme